MGFFDKVQETFRDKDTTRDDLCAGLQSMGIDAQMAERGRIEECIEYGSQYSLGLIDIPEGPIRWINVIRIVGGGLSMIGSYYYMQCGVPDSRLRSNSPKVEIKSTLKGDNWQWKGKDSRLGIIERLNSDTSLGYALLGYALLQSKGKESGWRISPTSVEYVLHWRKSPEMTIRAVALIPCPERNCWLISSQMTGMPSEELWSCYQAIARHLLAEWSPGHK